MALVDSLKKVSSKVITKFGGDVTVRIVTAGAYDTSDGTISETESDTTIKGILEDVNLREVNELVQAGDKRLTVAADDLTTAPETKDRVVISSVVHQIIRVETTEQDNTAITHELILRA
jgi:hypothetical protein|tara:strand:- start:1132 stop:1488 length:357 start_codon:yes stop_codon:yes gene_type:complete